MLTIEYFLQEANRPFPCNQRRKISWGEFYKERTVSFGLVVKRRIKKSPGFPPHFYKGFSQTCELGFNAKVHQDIESITGDIFLDKYDKKNTALRNSWKRLTRCHNNALVASFIENVVNNLPLHSGK